VKAADHYIKLVEWSEEDHCYVGSSPGFIGPCCHGSDETQVYRELCEIVAEWVEIHQAEAIPLPAPSPIEPFRENLSFVLDKICTKH